MSEFTNTTQMQFEPGVSGSIDLGSTGSQYTTPAVFRETLGDLARLAYLKARFAIAVLADAATSAVITVEVKSTSGTHYSTQLSFAAGTEVTASGSLDLSGVRGQEELYVEITVDTADAGKTATLRSKLTLEHPLVVSTCG